MTSAGPSNCWAGWVTSVTSDGAEPEVPAAEKEEHVFVIVARGNNI